MSSKRAAEAIDCRGEGGCWGSAESLATMPNKATARIAILIARRFPVLSGMNESRNMSSEYPESRNTTRATSVKPSLKGPAFGMTGATRISAVNETNARARWLCRESR